MAGGRRCSAARAAAIRKRHEAEKRRQAARERQAAARQEAYEDRLELKERKLRNAVEAAALTEGLKDDRQRLRNLIAFYRAEERNRNLSDKVRAEARRKEIAARKKLKALKADDAKKGGVGAQSGAEFLASLQGTLNTYGGKLFAPGELRVGGRASDAGGALTAHTIIQTSLFRDLNRMIYYLGQQTRLPASRAGYTNITSLYEGMAT